MSILLQHMSKQTAFELHFLTKLPDRSAGIDHLYRHYSETLASRLI